MTRSNEAVERMGRTRWSQGLRTGNYVRLVAAELGWKIQE